MKLRWRVTWNINGCMVCPPNHGTRAAANPDASAKSRYQHRAGSMVNHYSAKHISPAMNIRSG